MSTEVNDYNARYRERGVNRNFPPESGVLSWDVLPIAQRQRLRLAALEVTTKRLQMVQLAVYSGNGRVRYRGWPDPFGDSTSSVS